MLRFVASVTCVLAVLGCSSDSGSNGSNTDGGSTAGGAVGSCAGGKESGCTQEVCCQDYHGLFTASQARDSCNAISGVYSTTACTAQDLAGSCVLYEGTAAEQVVRYYTGYTFLDNAAGAVSAAANCDALHIGTYVPAN